MEIGLHHRIASVLEDSVLGNSLRGIRSLNFADSSFAVNRSRSHVIEVHDKAYQLRGRKVTPPY